MTNDPHHKRASKDKLVKWLLEHPSAWEGYPKPNLVNGMSHSNWIFVLLQNAGLFSPRSQCNPLTISRLVEQARFSTEHDKAVKFREANI